MVVKNELSDYGEKIIFLGPDQVLSSIRFINNLVKDETHILTLEKDQTPPFSEEDDYFSYGKGFSLPSNPLFSKKKQLGIAFTPDLGGFSDRDFNKLNFTKQLALEKLLQAQALAKMAAASKPYFPKNTQHIPKDILLEG